MIRTLTIASLAVAAMAASPVAAATWSVDKAQSKLAFQGTVEGKAFQGAFNRWDAQISFDPKALATSKVSVTIDAASAATGDRDRDETIPTDDWFAVKRFPTATFVAQKFVDQGNGRYQAIGDLTIKGVKKPIVLPFTLAITGDVAKMNASLVLDRTAFGVGSGQWKSGDEVGTKVTVVVALTARKAH